MKTQTKFEERISVAYIDVMCGTPLPAFIAEIKAAILAELPERRIKPPNPNIVQGSSCDGYNACLTDIKNKLQ